MSETTENKSAPSMEAILDGMRQAVSKVIEEAKRDDRELVISRNGKIIKIKAREL